jgi:hypothetical protein
MIDVDTNKTNSADTEIDTGRRYVTLFIRKAGLDP